MSYFYSSSQPTFGQYYKNTPLSDPNKKLTDHPLVTSNFNKVYRNSHSYVDDESDLFYAELSNLKEKNQLFTRPYAGFYAGPGQPSLDNKELESALQQGLLTNLRQKPCEVTRGTTFFRY